MTGAGCERFEPATIAAVDGRVSLESGRPVSGAWVVGCGGVARTDDDGSFHVAAADPPWPCSIEVRCDPFLPGRRYAVADRSKASDLRLTISPDPLQRGQDVDAILTAAEAVHDSDVLNALTDDVEAEELAGTVIAGDCSFGANTSSPADQVP